MRNIGELGQTILVTGATGRQGGAAARHLIGAGYSVRALTRDPRKPGAEELARRGIDLVQGDLNDRESVRRALEGCDGVFSVQDFWQSGAEGEIRQGRMLADLAKEAGVKHFVYSSVASADRATGLAHFDSKWAIEEHIRSLGLPYTILRPVFFMENWQSYVKDAILQGTLPQPLRPERRLQQIATDDIGAFAAIAFKNRERWLGREVDIAGDEPRMVETAEILSRVLGREVKYMQVHWGDFGRMAGAEMTRMYQWFEEVGYDADILECRREYPPLRTLEQELRQEQWPGVQAGATG